MDEQALRRALESGHLAGAVVDVFENEENFDSVLIGAPNLILTPHIAGTTRQAQCAVMHTLIERVKSALGQSGCMQL